MPIAASAASCSARRRRGIVGDEHHPAPTAAQLGDGLDRSDDRFVGEPHDAVEVAQHRVDPLAVQSRPRRRSLQSRRRRRDILSSCHVSRRFPPCATPTARDRRPDRPALRRAVGGRPRRARRSQPLEHHPRRRAAGVGRARPLRSRRDHARRVDRRRRDGVRRQRRRSRSTGCGSPTATGAARDIAGVLGGLEVVDEGAGGVLPHERVTPKASTDRLDLTRAHEGEPVARVGPVARRRAHAICWPSRVNRWRRSPSTASTTSSNGSPIPTGSGHRREDRHRRRPDRRWPSSLRHQPHLPRRGARRQRRPAEPRRRDPGVRQRTRGRSAVGRGDPPALPRRRRRRARDHGARRLLRALATPVAPTTRTLATMDSEGVLCLVLGDGTAQWLRHRDPGAFDAVRPLDGAWLEHALADIDPLASRYQHGVDHVVDAVTSGAAAAAVLIRPVSVAEIERTAREGAADATQVDVLHPEAAHRSGGPQPRVRPHGLRRRGRARRSATASSAASTRLRCRVGTTASATTSVRLCVAPPTRKNRRCTVPTTTTFVAVGKTRRVASLVGSFQAIGTDTVIGPIRRTRRSWTRRTGRRRRPPAALAVVGSPRIDRADDGDVAVVALASESFMSLLPLVAVQREESVTRTIRRGSVTALAGPYVTSGLRSDHDRTRTPALGNRRRPASIAASMCEALRTLPDARDRRRGLTHPGGRRRLRGVGSRSRTRTAPTRRSGPIPTSTSSTSPHRTAITMR